MIKAKRNIRLQLLSNTFGFDALHHVLHVDIIETEAIFRAGRVYAGRAVQDFWRALPNAIFSHDHKVLSLVDSTTFLGTPSFGDKLLVRECYHGLQRAMGQHFGEGGQGLVVVGNPGIDSRYTTVSLNNFNQPFEIQGSERA